LPLYLFFSPFCSQAVFFFKDLFFLNLVPFFFFSWGVSFPILGPFFRSFPPLVVHPVPCGSRLKSFPPRFFFFFGFSSPPSQGRVCSLCGNRPFFFFFPFSAARLGSSFFFLSVPFWTGASLSFLAGPACFLFVFSLFCGVAGPSSCFPPTSGKGFRVREGFFPLFYIFFFFLELSRGPPFFPPLFLRLG